MKKLLRNIALLLLPILLYYVVFLIFEPNNYFGLRATTPSGAVFGAIREYQKDPVDAIIVGDSRLAHFDMDLVEEVSGKHYGNLAFGGASLKEQIDLLEWTLENYPGIDEVIFGLSFYTLNGNYASDRFEDIEKALYNPFVYMTNLSYNLDVIDRVRLTLQGEVLDGGEHETEDPADYEYTEFTDPETGETVLLRSRIVDYMDDIAPYTRDWTPNEAQFDRLVSLIESCSASGIRFVIVMPPVDDAILKYEVVQTGIVGQMVAMQQQLLDSSALVLDYELTHRPDLREDQFFDGFHLDYERGLPEWTRMLFTDIKNGEIDSYGA